MNRDEEIEAALRRRPSDERVYGESLTDLVAANGMTRVRPATRPRSRTGARPALLAVIVVLAVGAGAVEIGLLNRSTSQRDLGGNTLELTGRVACFGQGPGWAPNTDSTSAESCPVMVVPPDGYGAATWTLDPSVPYSGGATEIHILVDEWGCHGFETAAGRIVQNVQYRDDAVIVTLAVRWLEGMQTCPGTPPTPYVLHLPQSVGSRELQDGGLWPAKTIATGGRVVTTPTPTPYPANWHQPIECTGEADGPGSFKSASMTANFDVYCAALPAGWMRASMSDFQQVVTSVTVTYRGPEGAVFELAEGDFCTESATACAPGGSDLGPAMFGERQGQLVKGPPGAEFALYVAPGQSPSWKATGSGMTVEAFKSLTAGLIVVGK